MDFRLFAIPIIVMFVIQVSKIVFYRGGWNWERLKRINAYGGMPSSHSAMVTSLAMTIWYYEGIASPAFAVALIVALITIRDANGFRQQVSRHSTVINKLIKELPDTEEYKFPVLKEIFGHKTIEVVAGILAGIVLSYLLFLIWA